MKKCKSFFNKIFKNSKNNSIISIVALVECIILITLSVYSWIESSSSLVIKGEDLPIASNLNYRFDVQESGTSYVDLSTYFRPTALYQLAQCSSANGKNFYFKKNDGTDDYRKGDTTDYNTSYYNFDFQVHNATSKNYNYFFESANIFKVTSDDEAVTDDIKTTVADAMRICVTSGTTAQSSMIFSRTDEIYSAIYSEEPLAQETESKGLENSNYVYNNNSTEAHAVFKSTHGGEDTKVNVKIWFEEQDSGWKKLTAAQKEAALGCTININLKFMNSASDFQTIMFDDYTFSVLEGHEGKPMTTEDPDKSMYFCYTGGEKVQIVPMIITENSGGALRWITSDDDQVNAAPRISKDILDDITATPANGYFFYGTVSSTNTPNVTYKWTFDVNSKPAQNDAGTYIYQALSVTKNSANSSVGFGVWSNQAVELIQFRDRTTGNTENAYNSRGYQYVVKGGSESLYLNDSGLYETQTTRMYYDEANDIWKGYYLVASRASLKFMYSTDNRCGNNIKCVWNAQQPVKDKDGKYTYTGLGYTDSGVLNNFTSSSTKAGTTSGFGTWGEVEQIFLSAELIDNGLKSTHRFKIGLASDTKYHYMARYDKAHYYFAFVPVGYGNTAGEALGFQYFDTPAQTQAGSTYNMTEKALRDKSNIYYLTGRNTGQWHIGVVVDGSAWNIVNDTLTNVEGAKLEWSTDQITYYPMIKLDNYRWYAEDNNVFTGDTTKLYYRYTAYPNSSTSSQDGAIFSYGHDLANGIYLTIME